MGLGGGFLMTVYSRGTGLTEVLNARETAPAFANPNMYVGCAFDHFENEIISLSWGLYFPCKGTRLTPLSPQKDPWLSLFLGRSPDIGRLAEGLVLIHFQNVATNRFAGMETQAYRGKGFWGRASGWPGRESQCQTLLQTPSQTKTGLPKNLTHLPEFPLKINQNILSKSTRIPSPNQRLDPTLKETFTDPSTGAGWVEKSKHRRPRLAASLEALAEASTLFV